MDVLILAAIAFYISLFAGASQAQGSATITKETKAWIEKSCTGSSNAGGIEYHECVSKHIADAIKYSQKIDWSNISETSRTEIEKSCDDSKSLGPKPYYECIRHSIARKSETPPPPIAQSESGQDGDIDAIIKRKSRTSPPLHDMHLATGWKPATFYPTPEKPRSNEPTEIYSFLSKSIHLIVAGTHDGDKVEDFDSLGTGVAITENTIVTNAHIISGRKFIYIKANGKLYPGRVIAYDADFDRCVITTNTKLRPAWSYRPFSDLKVGEKVYTIGNPSGLESTFSEGMISGLRPTNNVNFIQTTAPISPGSSGGALLDRQGRLIGITSFLLKNAQNLNFAISITDFILEENNIGATDNPKQESKSAEHKPTQESRGAISALHLNKSIFSRILQSTNFHSELVFDSLNNHTSPIRNIANTNKALTYNQKGHASLKDGKIKEASDNFKLAYENNNANAEYSGNYGYTEYLQGNFSIAEKMLLESLESNPKRASAWFSLGEVYAFMGFEVPSINCLRIACLTTRNIETTKKLLNEKSEQSESSLLRRGAKLVLQEQNTR